MFKIVEYTPVVGVHSATLACMNQPPSTPVTRKRPRKNVGPRAENTLFLLLPYMLSV
jgi:hypothetical protein